MNSIVQSAQARHPGQFMRHVSSAEAEYQRACAVFGHDSAEAMAAWSHWQAMRRVMQTSAPVSQ